jgi:hypothetical protein
MKKLVEVIQSVCINELVEEEVWRKDGDAAEGAQILDLKRRTPRIVLNKDDSTMSNIWL